MPHFPGVAHFGYATAMLLGIQVNDRWPAVQRFAFGFQHLVFSVWRLLHNLPLLVVAAVVWPLDRRGAIRCRTTIDIERLPAVAVGYFKIPKTHIHYAPLLVIAAVIVPLNNTGAASSRTAIHIQRLVAIAVNDAVIAVTQAGYSPLLVIAAPVIPLHNSAAIGCGRPIYVERFIALPAYDAIPGRTIKTSLRKTN